MMLAALAKCKKVYTAGTPLTGVRRYWFPTEHMVAIESAINDVVEANK